MLLKWKVIVLALPVALLVACKDQPSAPRQQTPAIAADFMNNPDNGNPRIWRYGNSVWWIYWEDGRYGAWHISGPYRIGMDPAVCGPDHGYFTEGQIVWPEQEEWWTSIVHSHDMGDLWVVILDKETPGDCLGKAVVAQGPATFRAIYTDAGDAWFGIDNGRANSSIMNFASEGDLTTPAGGTVRYNGHLHLTWAADNLLKNSSAQVILR